MSNTATVETLTAEVRVLMVGNRQITAGVANQLDSVTWWDLKPFGRYRQSDGTLRIIGSNNTDGTLVTAPMPPRYTEDPAYICDGDLPAGKTVVFCEGVKSSKSGEIRATWRKTTPVTFCEGTYSRCGHSDHRWKAGCEFWNPNGLDEYIDKAVQMAADEAADYKAAWSAASSLPLIVLASMR